VAAARRSLSETGNQSEETSFRWGLQSPTLAVEGREDGAIGRHFLISTEESVDLSAVYVLKYVV